MNTAKDISANFPFGSNYIEIHDSQMHYIEEGAGDPMLFLHGNPTSSYLWRNIIPYLSDHGRCIALDLIGFGKSDKPDIQYRFFDHVKYVEGFIDKMGLGNITLIIHDWGSALGFHYAMRHENNIKGIAFMEAILTPMKWSDFPSGFRIGFRLFRMPVIGWFLIGIMNMFVEQILPKATVRKFTKEEMAYYREPFRNLKSRRPVWRWPNEVPIQGKPADVNEAVEQYRERLRKSDLPKILFHARPGGIMPKPVVEWCRQNLKNLKTIDIGQGIHYLQEDNPHLIGKELAEWYQNL